MKTVVARRLQDFTDTGSLGVVNDIRFVNCFWPRLSKPTELFAKGSSGLEVLGSSRNVVWPSDTVFLAFYPDALYPAELAVLAASKGRRGLVNLSDEESAIWQAAYDKAVATFPPTHAIHQTRDDVHFLLHEQVIDNPKKPELFVAELSKAEVADLMTGKIAEADLRAAKAYVNVTSDAGPDAKVYQLDPNTASLVEVAKP